MARIDSNKIHLKLDCCSYTYGECMNNISLARFNEDYYNDYQEFYYDAWENCINIDQVVGDLKRLIWAKNRTYFEDTLAYWNYIDGPKNITYSEHIEINLSGVITL